MISFFPSSFKQVANRLIDMQVIDAHKEISSLLSPLLVEKISLIKAFDYI